MSAAGCGHSSGHSGQHEDLAEELRRYVFGALQLVEPYIEQVRDAQPTEESAARSACDECPVCAVIVVMRGGRSELAARLAEHATGLVAVLRSALAEGLGHGSASCPGAHPDDPADPAGPSGAPSEEPRGVQRIQVSRQDASGAC